MRPRRRRKPSKLLLTFRKKWVKTGALFVVAAISLAFFSRWAISRGVFDIHDVRIVGARFSDPLEILEVAAPELGPDIFQNYRSVSATLRRMPLIKDVDVDRIPPDRIVIHVVEREPIAILGGDPAQPVDEDGWLLPMDLSDYDIDLPIIQPTGEWTVNTGGRVESESVRIAIEFLKNLRERDVALLQEISVLSVEDEDVVRFTTVSQGFEVYLHRDSSNDEFYLLRDVMKDLTDKGKEFCTIDMRFNDQIVVF